jgi:hypothetical protein
LYDSEIPEVILGLHLRLKQLLEKKEDAEKAETALRCMHRLLSKNPGRPKYQKFGWEYLAYIVEDGEEYLPGLMEKMRGEKKVKENNESG